MRTQQEINERQKQYRKENGNTCTLKYEKTKNGFLVRKYRNMESRVLGIQKRKSHLYKNLYLLPRKHFYTWAISNETFNKLFQEWIAGGYDRKLCPSVDRIDSSKGYILKNMEWVTHSENSRRGAINRHKLKI